MISSFLREGQNIFLVAETELKSKQKETITFKCGNIFIPRNALIKERKQDY